MNYKKEPWKHQIKGIKYCSDKNYFALFYEQRVGKTLTVINGLRAHYYKADKVLKTVVFCPLGTIFSWENEFLDNTFISKKEILVPEGTGVKRLKQLDNFSGSIIILNIDSISIDAIWKYIILWGVEALIIDESQRFKNPKAKRTKKMIALSDQPQCKNKYLLSGTPITKDAMDLWSQFRIMNKRILGENYFAFRAKYFYDANAGMPRHLYFPNWKPRKELEQELNDIVHKYSQRILLRDVFDVKETAPQKLYSPLGGEQGRIYKELRDDFVSYLDDDVCVADMAIVKGLRLQQLITGIFVNDKKEVILLKDSPREKILKELLEDLPREGQKVIWSTFKPTYKVIGGICEKLKLKYMFVTGNESGRQKKEAEDAFNAGKINILICNQAAGGLGMTFVGAPCDYSIHNIYYSRDFNYEHDEQSNSRCYSGNQDKFVSRIDIIAKGTIDEHMLESLKTKENTSKAILNLRGKL